MKKIILVTGASSGIGLACANQLYAAGHTVYGSSRDLKRMESVLFNPLQLDVTNDASVSSAYKEIIRAEGRLDVLINNAGNGVIGPAYAMPVEVAKQQFDVNFFGLIRMSNAVLEGMIAANTGLIINISSLAGLFGLPYQSMYCASKYAVEAYSQSLRMELHNTGIKVVLINPGDYKSNFTANRKKIPFVIKNDKLLAEYNGVIARVEQDENMATNPEPLAKQLVEIIESSNPSHRYLTGDFNQRILPRLKNILSNSLFEKLMNGHYNIK